MSDRRAAARGSGRRLRVTARHVVAVASVVGIALLGAVLAFGGNDERSASGPLLLPTGAGPCTPPYDSSGPWNAPIPAGAERDESRSLDPGAHLSSDPTQFTFPVYQVDASTPRVRVRIGGTYSNVTAPDVLDRGVELDVMVPIPDEAQASEGSDGQLILLDPDAGDEWGFWQLGRDGDEWVATNGYHYNTRWSGVPPPGFGSRGAGMPYLAGLIRPCEIQQGRIDHALAFAYNYPSPDFVYPARKSDGEGDPETDFPEGTRLQLDPSLDDADLAALGITGPALTVAHAMQTHGMYVVDNSGRPKIYFEDDVTAQWQDSIVSRTVRSIPVDSIRAVPSPPEPPLTAPATSTALTP